MAVRPIAVKRELPCDKESLIPSLTYILVTQKLLLFNLRIFPHLRSKFKFYRTVELHQRAPHKTHDILVLVCSHHSTQHNTHSTAVRSRYMRGARYPTQPPYWREREPALPGFISRLGDDSRPGTSTTSSSLSPCTIEK